jgi:hypothetical protein
MNYSRFDSTIGINLRANVGMIHFGERIVLLSKVFEDFRMHLVLQNT